MTYKRLLILIEYSLFLYSIVTIAGSHSERLTILKNKGFNPKIIYDIGAYRGEWTTEIKQVFDQAHFFLFEANEHHRPYLEKLKFPYFLNLLGNREELATFYVINNTGDSLFKEQTTHYEGHCLYKTIQMTTLESLIKKNNLPLPDLIKMDVQGAEKLIIEGGPSIVCNAEIILLEVAILEYNKNAPLIYEMMTFMNDLGYVVLDFIELHYLPTKELFEVDILFVKSDSSLIKRGILG